MISGEVSEQDLHENDGSGQNSGQNRSSPVDEPKKYACKHNNKDGEPCGFSADSPLVLGAHVRSSHPNARKKKTHDDNVESHDTPVTEDEIIADIRMKGPGALHAVLRRRLEELLTAPGIMKVSSDFALQEWDRNPIIRDDVNILIKMLAEDAGIKDDKARRVGEKIYELIQRYSQYINSGGYQYYYQPYGQGQPAQYQGQPSYGRQNPQYDMRGPPQFPQQGYDMRQFPGDPRYDMRGGYDPRYDRGGYPPPWAQGQPSVTREDVRAAVEAAIDKMPQKQEEPMVSVPVYEDGELVVNSEGNQLTTSVPAKDVVTYMSMATGAGRRSKEQPSGLPPDVKIQMERLETQISDMNKQLVLKDKEMLEKRLGDLDAQRERDKTEAERRRTEDKQSFDRQLEAIKHQPSTGATPTDILNNTLVKGFDMVSKKLDQEPLMKGIEKVLKSTQEPKSVAEAPADTPPSGMRSEIEKRLKEIDSGQA